jgi:hypothetical protein
MCGVRQFLTTFRPPPGKRCPVTAIWHHPVRKFGSVLTGIPPFGSPHGRDAFSGDRAKNFLDIIFNGMMMLKYLVTVKKACLCTTCRAALSPSCPRPATWARTAYPGPRRPTLLHPTASVAVTALDGGSPTYAPGGDEAEKADAAALTG